MVMVIQNGEKGRFDKTGGMWYNRCSTNAACHRPRHTATAPFRGVLCVSRERYSGWQNRTDRIPLRGALALRGAFVLKAFVEGFHVEGFCVVGRFMAINVPMPEWFRFSGMRSFTTQKRDWIELDCPCGQKVTLDLRYLDLRDDEDQVCSKCSRRYRFLFQWKPVISESLPVSARVPEKPNMDEREIEREVRRGA